MNAIDIYEDIKNPLDNQGFIKNIFTGYLKTNNFDEFSDYIKRFSETKNFTLETNIIGEEAHKKFISFMFNIWKNNVINTKIELIPKNKYNINKLLETKELLQDITDLDYIEKIYNTKEDISWYRMDTYYTYISSYDVDLVQKDEIVKEHMLFLNINSKSALFRIIESFIIRCKIFKIPYNFKYSNNINNDSTLVIYSNTSLLAQYVYLLNDICSDNELNITISYPKLLSGIIDKFIGYESYISEDEELFTTQRLKVIYTVLDKELPLLYNNLFNIFISEHQYQTFKDYIFNEILSSKEKILERNSNNIFYFYKLKKIINNIKKINYKDIKNEEIKFGLKNKITIKKEEISELYIGLLNVLFRKYPEYVKIIVDEIKKLGLEYEIDNYTFCFDLDTIDKISLYELGTTIIPVEDRKMKKLI